MTATITLILVHQVKMKVSNGVKMIETLIPVPYQNEPEVTISSSEADTSTSELSSLEPEENRLGNTDW